MTTITTVTAPTASARELEPSDPGILSIPPVARKPVRSVRPVRMIAPKMSPTVSWKNTDPRLLSRSSSPYPESNWPATHPDATYSAT